MAFRMLQSRSEPLGPFPCLGHADCQPRSPSTNGLYQLLNSLIGWNNTATVGSVAVYIGYWWCIIGSLVWMKWKEGRMKIGGLSRKRRIRLEETVDRFSGELESDAVQGRNLGIAR